MAKIFLYGGCVIRDASQMIDHDVETSGYVARQSLISAISPPAILPAANLESPFQSRMVDGDVNSSLLHSMRKAAAHTDLFVMDCHIERVGVYRLPDASFVTASPEMNRSGILRNVTGHSRIHLGSSRHTDLWTQAANRFVARLEEFGLKEKTLVIDAPWVEADESGVPFPPRNGRTVREVGQSISSLTAILANLGVSVARMPTEVAVAPVDHRWGPGPYHFGAAAMEWTATQMRHHLRH